MNSDLRTPEFPQSSWNNYPGVKFRTTDRGEGAQQEERKYLFLRSIAKLHGNSYPLVNVDFNDEIDVRRKNPCKYNLQSKIASFQSLFSPSMKNFSIDRVRRPNLFEKLKRPKRKGNKTAKILPEVKASEVIAFFNQQTGAKVSWRSKLRWSSFVHNLSQSAREQMAEACLMNKMLLPQILLLFSHDPAIFYFSENNRFACNSVFLNSLFSILSSMAPSAKTDVFLLDTIKSRLKFLLMKLLSQQYIDPILVFNNLLIPLSCCNGPESSVHFQLCILIFECISKTPSGQLTLKHSACKMQMRQIANDYFRKLVL